jgi:hypothetical protein
MIKYLNALLKILKNYKLYLFPILIMELIFFMKYNSKFNKFKNLNSNQSSDPIPCSFYVLRKIERFIIKNNIKTICDLGSGYGKIIYFLGFIKKFQIDGVELDNEIYKDTLFLKDTNINIFNENILNFKLENKKYDLLIINDPLKRIQDFDNLIKKIKTINYKVFIVMINISLDKIKIANDNLEIINNKFFSKNRNVLFFKK